jgi:ubiquitin-protein ligase
MSHQTIHEKLDKIRKKSLQLFSASETEESHSKNSTQGSTSSSYAPLPQQSSSEWDFLGLHKDHQNTQVLAPVPSNGPSFVNAPFLEGLPSTAVPSEFIFAPNGSKASGPYGLGMPLNYNKTRTSGGPSVFGFQFASGPSWMRTPSSSSKEDEEIARQLQELYDSEDFPNPPEAKPYTLAKSPFMSDQEYSISLAQGFNQHNGSPLPPPVMRLSRPSIQADEEYAKQLQKELDSADQRVSGKFHVERTSSIAKPTSPPPIEEPIDIGAQADIAALHKFGQQMLMRGCANCKKHLLYSEKDIVKLSKKWLNDKQGKLSYAAYKVTPLTSPSGRIDSVLQCPKCSKHTCIGCGKTHKTYKSSSLSVSKPTKAHDVEITMCCQEGRLFLIWSLLCAADHQKSCNDRRDAFFAKCQPPRRSNSDPAKGRGGRFSTRTSNGIGYGGQDGYHGTYFSTYYHGIPPLTFNTKGRYNPTPPKATPILKENTEEVLLTHVFTALTKLLPALVETGHPFDFDPPEILPVIIKRSPVLEKAANLLRNDSLDDLTKRHKLYEALLGFVQRLASHPATAQIVFAQRVIYPADAGLLSASFNENRYELRSIGKGKFKAETSCALSDITMQLEVSARKMLQRYKAAEDDFKTLDGINMLNLCKGICDLAELLQGNVLMSRKSNDEPGYKGKGKEIMRVEEDLSKWNREHCVDEVPDSEFEATFSFWREAMANQSQPRKGRMKSLITDLAVLQTSLPDGIYVRHGGSRLDMMKILIVGPKGTPYEGGLFEFDLFCPANYPESPPRMQFKTTGGGAASFNPNLYADGKVCLSLLGTWAGQPWIASGPNKSTLLQLCVSIQSMILCDEPWYNEPGREKRPDPAASMAYNRLIQCLTLRYALTNWLDIKNLANPIWKDVIEKHFRLNGESILKSVRVWSKSAEEHAEKNVPAWALHQADDDLLFGYGKVNRHVPSLVKDFEKALQATFGVVHVEQVLVSGTGSAGGEGKRKFGAP